MDKASCKRIRVGDINVVLYCRHERFLQSLDEFIKNSIIVAREFFSDVILENEIQIKLLCSRAEFDKIFGKPTEDWLSGSIKKGKILIFHPDVLNKESSHKKKEFSQILTHEICHIFIHQINCKVSWWLDEGVSQYVAGQKPTRKISLTDIDYFINNHLFKNSNYDAFIYHNGYQIAYMITELLIKKYGKNTVMELLKIKSGKQMKKEFLSVLDEDAEIFVRNIEKLESK